jgi:hypothetical protein
MLCNPVYLSSSRITALLISFGLGLTSSSAAQFTRVEGDWFAASGGPSQGIGWTDYDNDGYPDVVVTNMLYPTGYDNWLYHNDGGISLETDLTSIVSNDGGPSRAPTWGDYDNDGDPDLFLTNLGSRENFLYRNDGLSGFAKVTGETVNQHAGASTSASWLDYDNDGDLDLYVSNYGSNLLLRNDAGSFTSMTDIGPAVTDAFDSYGVACGDYDNDGDVDLFVAVVGEGSPNKDNHLYTNNGDGTFTTVTGQDIVSDGGQSCSGSWGDYDNDGDLDLFVSNLGLNPNFLYCNNGDGTFAAVSTGCVVTDIGYSFGSAWGDYDNDGDLDLYVANYVYGVSTENFLYTNDGAGNFERVVGTAIATDVIASFGVAWADFDRDGDLDLAVANAANDNENNTFYINNGNGNNWVNLKLVGRASNTSAIGAKVRLKAAVGGSPVWQMREVSGQTGYCSQNDLNVHFGVGDAVEIDSLRIEWPSGIVQVLESVPANQFMTIVEPCCMGRVGDVNASGEDDPTIGDVSMLIDAKFIAGSCDGLVTCLTEADINQSGGTDPTCDDITIGDVSYLIDYLFITGSTAMTLPDCL